MLKINKKYDQRIRNNQRDYCMVRNVLTLRQCPDACLVTVDVNGESSHDKFSLIDWLPSRRIIHQNSPDDSRRAIRSAVHGTRTFPRAFVTFVILVVVSVFPGDVIVLFRISRVSGDGTPF